MPRAHIIVAGSPLVCVEEEEEDTGKKGQIATREYRLEERNDAVRIGRIAGECSLCLVRPS